MQLFASFSDTEGIANDVLAGVHQEVDAIFKPAPTLEDLDNLWEHIDCLKARSFKDLKAMHWADAKRWGIAAAISTWQSQWPTWDILDEDERMEAQHKVFQEHEQAFISDLASCFHMLQHKSFVTRSPFGVPC